MREIKFRAWEKIDKKMIVWEYMPLSVMSYMKSKYDNRHIFMQYTGLKDKNGKEIYEEDIVITSDETFASLTDKMVVAYIAPSFVIINPSCCSTCKARLSCIAELYNANCFEVIGNTYENSDLLENNKQ